MGFPIQMNALLELLPAKDGLEVPHLLALQASNDLTLQKHREAFVQPKVLPVGGGHQISHPAVRNLVGHHVYQRSIKLQGMQRVRLRMLEANK